MRARARHAAGMTPNVAGWLSPAGGVVYHLRARRYGTDLWESFRRALADWLAGWHPETTAILLVGPSAAYCLDDAFLARFRDVEVVEPDPVARWLLRRRLERAGTSRIVFRGDDPLLADPGALLDGDPSRAVLFCNVLGQVRFLLPDDTFASWATAFRAAAGARPWASFHDRVSGPLAPDLTGGADSDHGLDDEEIVARFYARIPDATAPHELLDHLTAGLWPATLPRRYLAWQVTPGRFHLIEAVRGDAGARGVSAGRADATAGPLRRSRR